MGVTILSAILTRLASQKQAVRAYFDYQQICVLLVEASWIYMYMYIYIACYIIWTINFTLPN